MNAYIEDHAERDRCRAEFWPIAMDQAASYDARGTALDYFIDAQYSDAIDDLRMRSRDAMRRVCGRFYCVGYTVTIGLYTAHWIRANAAIIDDDAFLDWYGGSRCCSNTARRFEEYTGWRCLASTRHLLPGRAEYLFPSDIAPHAELEEAKRKGWEAYRDGRTAAWRAAGTVMVICAHYERAVETAIAAGLRPPFPITLPVYAGHWLASLGARLVDPDTLAYLAEGGFVPASTDWMPKGVACYVTPQARNDHHGGYAG